MYHLRLKVVIMLCIGGLVIAIGRLVTLQVFHVNQARQELADLRVLPAEQRPTVRGKIMDRQGNALALDRPAFYLHIGYSLTRYMDPRWREGRILKNINEERTRAEVEQELYEEKWVEPTQQLEQAIDLAWELADVSREEIVETIEHINDFIWERSRYIWWLRRNPGSSRSQYLKERDEIPLQRIVEINLWEMHQTYPLVELQTHQDLLRAQIELLNLDGLEIRSEAKRNYPYGATACQLIGWVAPWREDEIQIFEHDKYMSYKEGEVVGKSGLEKVYEPMLRGRRGEVTYDREGNLVDRMEPQYGHDIRMTIDIDLQHKIEKLLAEKTMPHNGKPSAAVVLEVANNDILAAASIPIFDLNTIRRPRNYNRIFNPSDPNKLWQHKALERNYPPGSTAKPLVLVAGLEEKKIGPYQPISCSSWKMPPKGWPKCLLQRIGTSHDVQFGEGNNYARNAIRGSCNVYFSQLGHRLSSKQLQGWLFNFGFGQKILKTPVTLEYLSDDVLEDRNLRQARGCIEYAIVQKPVESASELKPIPIYENKWWGMGQGSLRATVLQVANALSVIARGGVYKSPRLVFDEDDPQNESNQRRLPISKGTLSVVREGMKAVVYEPHGTAYSKFKDSDLLNRDMTIYGKTGSTERPEHAWFECFAEDRSGRSIVIAVLVEGGLRGAGEAAPLGHEILRYCNEAGYIGSRPSE